jgi:hypothetical protein
MAVVVRLPLSQGAPSVTDARVPGHAAYNAGRALAISADQRKLNPKVACGA